MSRDWKYLLQRICSFDMNGKRVVGTIIEATDAGLTEKGAIPDATLVIRGASGATVTVSLVESRMQLKDDY